MNLRDSTVKSEPLNLCACMGPQNGQPLCPCAMRGVIVRNGRYIVPEKDIGPVPPNFQPSAIVKAAIDAAQLAQAQEGR